MDFVYFDLSDQRDPAQDGDGRAKLIRVEQYVPGHKDTHMANQACRAHRGDKQDLGGLQGREEPHPGFRCGGDSS